MSYPTGDSGTAPDPHAQPGLARPRNGLGIAALVLGLIALFTFWTVFGGILLGLAAIVLGIIGFRRQRRGQATNGTMAVIGAVLGVLALLASAIILAIGVSIFSGEGFDNLKDCLDNAQTAGERADCEKDFSDDITR